MEEEQKRIISLSTEVGLAEERMLGQELVREMIARRERGDGIKQIARELGVDRKTVKRWLRLGEWQPRRPQRRGEHQGGTPTRLFAAGLRIEGEPHQVAALGHVASRAHQVSLPTGPPQSVSTWRFFGVIPAISSSRL